MKKLLCFIFLVILLSMAIKVPLQAQNQKDLMISLGIGLIGSPQGKSFDSPSMGIGYSLDMSYFINPRHIIALNYTSGNHSYTEPYLKFALPNNLIPATSRIEFRTVSLICKYVIINNERFSFNLGTGLSLQTDIKRFPDYRFSDNIMVSLSYASIGGTDLAFPFKGEFSFNIANRWAIGLESGIFLMPIVYPWSGFHLLPRVSYVFR